MGKLEVHTSPYTGDKWIDSNQAVRSDEVRAQMDALAEQLNGGVCAMTEEQEIAEIMHDALCKWNHTDGCSWYYGSWDKMSYAHRKFLGYARRLIVRCGGKHQALTFMKSYQKAHCVLGEVTK